MDLKKRLKNAPPSELAHLLKVVNLAPMNVDFPSEQVLIEEFRTRTGIDISSDFIKNLGVKEFFWFMQDRVRQICKPFPALFDHIECDNQAHGHDDYAVDISTEYLSFLRDRRDLKALIEAKVGEQGRRALFTDSSTPSNYFTYAFIEGRRFVFELTPFAKALQGVLVDRISICPICQTIFWAFRRDMVCCKSKCAIALRMRKYRQRKHINVEETWERKQQERRARSMRDFSLR